MRKIVCFFLCCILLTAAAAAADITVSNLNTKCTVRENGDLELTQKVTLQVGAPALEITLPVGTNVSKASVDGAEASLHQKDGCTYATLRSKEGFSGEVTVSLSCLKRGSVQYEENGQLFSAELVCGLWELPSERYSFSVVFPKELSGTPDFLSGYHGSDVEDRLTVKTENRSVSGMLRGGLMDRDSFTMQLRMEPGYFSGVAEPAGVTPWIVAVLMLALCALGVFYWLRFLRSGRLRPSARTLPPDGITAAELPFLLCGEKPDFALLLFEWAAEGYLTITQNRTGRITLQKSMPMRSERRDVEQKIFQKLFSDSDTVDAGSERFRKLSAAASRLLRSYWVRVAFERSSGNPWIPRILASLVSALALLNTMNVILPPSGIKWLLLTVAFAAGAVCGTLIWYGLVRSMVRDRLWIGLGIAAFCVMFLLSRSGGFLLMLLALAADILVVPATLSGGKRTASGSDIIEQCLGYSRFLGHAEEAHLQTMIRQDPHYFYRIIIYANACGAEKHLAQKAATAVLERCDWFTAADGTSAVAPEFCRQLQSLRKALH